MSAILFVALVLIGLPTIFFAYGYFGYPAMLWCLARVRRERPDEGREMPWGWPTLSLSLPAYNEERSIGATLDRLLRLDYPSDRLQIVVVSDASTDATDEIVQEYAERGVALVRMPERRGKNAAEAAAMPHLRGEIVVNTDATILIPPGSLKPLVAVFRDPTIGVASGRDVSVREGESDDASESGYVGYEMWVRRLETRLGSIVGASGCFYAIRRHLHSPAFPESLSRDFASCIVAREHGYRSVSVDGAVCLVPRTSSVEREYHRKTRTMARGLATLWYKRDLLNPMRYGTFSWMLISHKLVRWLVWLTWPGFVLGLALLSTQWPPARILLLLAALALVVGWLGWRWPLRSRRPTVLAVLGYALASAVAGFRAWGLASRGKQVAIWEPTRR